MLAFADWLSINSVRSFAKHSQRKHLCCLTYHLFLTKSLLTTLGGSLAEFEINGAHCSPTAINSMLAGLPHLRRFLAHDLELKPDPTFVASRTVPPFFNSANKMNLLLSDYLDEKLAWIPSTARFSKLPVGIMCIDQNKTFLNRWIRSSRKSLKHLSLCSDDGCTCPEPALIRHNFPPPDDVIYLQVVPISSV